jgi:hypothetical protein
LGSFKATHDLGSMGQEFGDKDKALRAKYGLSDAEVDALGKVAGAVLVREAPLSKAVYAQIPQIEAQLAKLPSGVPAEVRSEAEKNLADLKAQKAEAEAMRQERAQFGDAVVDAMLAERERLLRVLPGGQIGAGK